MTGTPHDYEIDKEVMPTLSIDWELYAELLSESDLTDEEKREFIETLWSLIVSFVDLGFGISSESRITDLLADGLPKQIEAHMRDERRSP
ncbi:hypothetical protein V1T76_04465 [Roseibium sp. FZY0029]|uniref:hypothetical protein n=1 Tax=Roseibium sp. FZY0029 TaxID=3116647 RepID=UPI002EB0DF57|nr:hypothetical protein [Roseibium sp. FZY0029]